MLATMCDHTSKTDLSNGLDSSFPGEMSSLGRHSICRQREDVLSPAEEDADYIATLPTSPSGQGSPMTTPQISMEMEAFRQAVGHSRN